MNNKFIQVNVVFLCHDGSGNFLMSLRGKASRDNQGLWDPGSGKIEYGESSLQAVKRELKEEYNVSECIIEPLGVSENNHTDYHWITFEYLVKVNKNQVKNNEPKKLEDVKWFDFNELQTLKTHLLFPELLTKYKKKLEIIIN